MDTGKLYIPNLNAIPLFLKDQLPRDGYSVKYEQGDMTCIQLFCIDAEFEVKIYLRDVSGKLTGTFAVNTSTVRDENGIMIRFYTALIKFSQVNEGGYYIEISIKNNIGEVCSYYSPCIDVRKRHRKTFLTEYFNSENINNVLFDNGTSFALRVEGGFLPKSYIPKVQETIYQNQSVEFKLLQSMPYNSNTLTVGRERGVPDWIFDKVHRALSCDNTIIDNVAMTKIEGAAWSPNEEEGYNFRTWKIELVQNNDNISRPVLCVEQAVYTCSYEWLDADAVCQLEPDNVIETVEFAEYVCQVAQPLGNAFAKTATYRRYVNGELQEEITKSLLTDVNPVLTESQYQLLNVPDVEERVAAVIYLFDVETEPEYLSEAVIGNAECMNPEYVPVTFEDVFI
ncbi:MAG: hypothetical protein LBK58_12390, partial [Prevotellaceae bacterium]|nr:hypothetical protein [Prevotellaceae bacterium]